RHHVGKAWSRGNGGQLGVKRPMLDRHIHVCTHTHTHTHTYTHTHTHMHTRARAHREREKEKCIIYGRSPNLCVCVLRCIGSVWLWELMSLGVEECVCECVCVW